MSPIHHEEQVVAATKACSLAAMLPTTSAPIGTPPVAGLAHLQGPQPMFARSMSAPHLLFGNTDPPFMHTPPQLNSPFHPYVPHPFDQGSFHHPLATASIQYPGFSTDAVPPTMPPMTVLPGNNNSNNNNNNNNNSNCGGSTQGHQHNHSSSNSMSRSSDHYSYQQTVHPFQMDQLASSISDLDAATEEELRFNFSQGEFEQLTQEGFPSSIGHFTSAEISSSSISCSPLSTAFQAEPQLATPDQQAHATGGNPFEAYSTLPPRLQHRGCSMPFTSANFRTFKVPDEYPAYLVPRHGSLGSLYPMTQSHELLDSVQVSPASLHMEESAPMLSTSSSTSISSTDSSLSMSSQSKAIMGLQDKVKQRRASLSPDASGRVFTCLFDDCRKVFKRSEHLKRHVRSVHTLEKPFVCPYQGCIKRFSRSDNLSQHVRVHRNDKEKMPSKPLSSFTPFLVSRASSGSG